MKRTKTIFATLLIIIFVFAGISAYASDENNIVTEENDASKLYEIENLRTTTSNAYEMSDGTIRHELFATKINYEDETGKLKPIDIKIKDIDSSKNQGYKYKNGENDWNVYFADKGKAQDMVKIQQDNYAISFSLASSKENAIVNKAKDMQKGKSELHDYYTEDPTVVMFSDIMTDVDLAYTIRETYLKEDIILNSKSAINKFKFDITTKDLIVVLENGRLLFKDKQSGEEVFTSSDLFMEDSAGHVSTNVIMNLDKVGENQYILTIIADEVFLNDASTVYPVVIDPTIQNGSTYDVFVSSYMPTTNMNSGDTRAPYLRTGKDTTYGIRRSYIKFLDSDIDNAVASGYEVSTAYLDICKYSYSGSILLRAYRAAGSCSSNTLTWSNMPSYYSTPVSSSYYYGSDFYRMNVSAWVEGWEDGSIANNGVVVRAFDESSTSIWTTFRSSDNWNTAERPRLVINTTAPTPTATPTPTVTPVPTPTPMPTSPYPQQITVDIKLIFEESFDDEYTYPVNTMIDCLNNAEYPFTNYWNIDFDYDGNTYSVTGLPGDDCPEGHDNPCDDTICGSTCVNSDSTPNHHKNAVRLLRIIDDLDMLGCDLQLLFLSHDLCWINSSDIHEEGIGGMADVNGNQALVLNRDNSAYDIFNIRAIQHELSHNYGCPEGGCTAGQNCIMNGGFDGRSDWDIYNIWCDYHRTMFDRTLH